MEAAEQVGVASTSARFAHWLSDGSGQLRKRQFAVVLAIAYALFTSTYIPINMFSVGRPSHTLFLPSEERLPFLPIFEYLYVLTYFIGALLIVTIRDYARFLRIARATGLSLLTAYATYLLFPVYFERPHLEVDSLHTWLLSLEYLDKPYNHFPSLHVTLSWLAVHASQVSHRSRMGLWILATGLSVSTVFVKQHYIADVLAGFVLAWVAWRVSGPGASKSSTLPTGAATASAAE
jgi:membrane-associated phospholipid phosphatase